MCGSPARFSKFQIEFSSGCSPLWITCIKIEFFGARSKNILGCSPAGYSTFQIKFFSGWSPPWITRIEIDFNSGRCPI